MSVLACSTSGAVSGSTTPRSRSPVGSESTPEARPGGVRTLRGGVMVGVARCPVCQKTPLQGRQTVCSAARPRTWPTTSSRFVPRANARERARGLASFVGRTTRMAQLVEALDMTRNGSGQVVAVVGDPGMGKSRLFWEFCHSRRANGCLVLESASVSRVSSADSGLAGRLGRLATEAFASCSGVRRRAAGRAGGRSEPCRSLGAPGFRGGYGRPIASPGWHAPDPVDNRRSR